MMERTELVRADWSARVESCVATVVSQHGENAHVLAHPDDRTTEVTQPDWGAFPVRSTVCLPRQSALEVLDWRSDQGDVGRRLLQEEYCEWRVVRDESERIQRIELTTELPDSWRSLAAHDPESTLDLMAERAGERHVPPTAAYGGLDISAPRVSPEDRELAFADATLRWEARNPYQVGERAICCMAHRTNTLRALVELVARSAFPYVVHDSVVAGVRPATAAEIIPRIWGSAQPGRNSDPVLVERLARLALERRVLALAEPVGIYVTGVESSRLRLPDGSEVPPTWFTLEPGALIPFLTDEPGWNQRVVFEIPSGEGISIGDLVDEATEQPITHGGQIADLIQLGLPIKTSAPEVVDIAPETLLAASEQPPLGCEEIRDAFETYQASRNAAQTGRRARSRAQR